MSSTSTSFVAYVHEDSEVMFIGIFKTWEEAARRLYERQKESFDPEDEEGGYHVSTWLTELKLYGKTGGTHEYEAIAEVPVSPGPLDDAFAKGLVAANAAFAKKEASARERRVKAKRKAPTRADSE